jgi:hypothetical protein
MSKHEYVVQEQYGIENFTFVGSGFFSSTRAIADAIKASPAKVHNKVNDMRHGDFVWITVDDKKFRIYKRYRD